MEAKRRRIAFYQDGFGREPAREWINSFRDAFIIKRIDARIGRAEAGNFGDYKSVGDGVFEMRMHFAQGYRLYYSIAENNELLLLLAGGDKSDQERDIQNAKKYWKDHQNGKS